MRRALTVKSLLIAAVVLIGLVVLVVALLPWMLNATGVGRSVVRSAIAPSVNGAVEIGAVEISWAGPQVVDDLVVTRNGREELAADAALHAGLWPLLFSTAEPYHVTLNGAAAGTLYADGSTSFADLVRTQPDEDEAPLSLEGVPGLHVNVAAFDVTLYDEAADRTVTFADLTGLVAYRPGETTVIELEGLTNTDGQAGRIAIDLDGQSLFDETGRLQPSGAIIEARVLAESIPVPQMAGSNIIERLEATLASDNLAEAIAFNADLSALLADAQDSRLTAEGTVATPFTADGALDIALDDVIATASGTNVPTSLIATFAPPLPEGINLQQQVGEVIESVEIAFSGGEPREAVVRITAPRLTADGRATFTTAEGGTAVASAEARLTALPALLGALLPTDALPGAALRGDGPVTITASVADGFVPDAGLAAMRGTATASLQGPVDVRLAGDQQAPLGAATAAEAAEPRVLRLTDLSVEVQSPALAEQAQLNAAAQVEGGRIIADLTARDLLDDAGDVAVAGAAVQGTLTASDLPRAAVLSFVEAANVRQMLDDVLGDTVALTADFEAEGGETQADVRADSGETTLATRLALAPDALQLSETQANVRITPGLLAAVQQQGAEAPVQLLDPTVVSVALQPFALPLDDGGAPVLDEVQIDGSITAPRIALRTTATAAPLTLRDVQGDVGFATGEMWRASLIGSAMAHVAAGTGTPAGPAAVDAGAPADGAELARATFDLTARNLRGEPAIAGQLALNNLATQPLATLLGASSETFARPLGDMGSITLTLDANYTDGRVALDFPRAWGAIAYEYQPGPRILTARSDDLNLTVGQDLLNTLADAQPAETTQQFRVLSDVPLTVEMTQLRIPLAMFTGGGVDGADGADGGDAALDPMAFELDATVTAREPLRIADPNQAQSTLDNLRLALRSEGLREGVAFTLDAAARTTRADEPIGGQVISGNQPLRRPAAADATGLVNVTGRYGPLVNQTGAFATDAAGLTLDATLTDVPTLIADALLQADGALVAMAGPTMSASINAQDFYREGGTISAEVTTPLARLQGAGVTRGGALLVQGDRAITAELSLTESARQQVLAKIHPIFNDVVQVQPGQRPVTATFREGAIPLEGGVAGLSGSLRLESQPFVVGPGSVMVQLLQFADAQVDAIPVEVQTIDAVIQQGVLRYQQAQVRIDEIPFRYDGWINLATNQVQLTVDVPVGALADAFGRVRELEGETVPLRYSGTLGNLQVGLSPDFDMAALVARAGLRDVDPELARLFERLGVPIRSGDGRRTGNGGINLGGLFDDLLRRALEEEQREKQDEGEDEEGGGN